MVFFSFLFFIFWFIFSGWHWEQHSPGRLQVILSSERCQYSGKIFFCVQPFSDPTIEISLGISQSPKLCMGVISIPQKKQAPFSLRGRALVAMSNGQTCILLANSQITFASHYTDQCFHWIAGADSCWELPRDGLGGHWGFGLILEPSSCVNKG